MKTNRIVMLVAAAALLFAACGKDENVVAGDNELVYDGATYKMEAIFGPINGSMGLMDIHSVDKNANGNYLVSTSEEMFHIYRHLVGDEINLAQVYSQGYHFVLQGAVNWDIYSEESSIGGTIEGTEYSNTSAFKSGTMKLSIEGSNMVFVLNGETKNGHKMSLRIVTPTNGWTN